MATTPKTVRTFTLDGTKKDFTIPFEYLARKFVVVTLIGATRRELVLNTEYRFSTATTITTTKAWGPADNFELIEIRRLTSATERLVNFNDGSILRAYDLNTSNIQSLHIAEEGRDVAADAIAVNDEGQLDARGRRIVRVADGIDTGDAVTLRQAQDIAAGSVSTANEAKLIANRAEAKVDAITADSTVALRAEMKNPAKGTNLLAFQRKAFDVNDSTLTIMLNSLDVSIWEFAYLVTDKPIPSNPYTWDWYPAISAAIDSIALTGGRLRFPRGVFKHSQKLVFKGSVSVQGAGNWYDRTRGTVLEFTGYGDGAGFESPPQTTSVVHSTFSDITFKNSESPLRTGAFADENSLHLVFDRVSFLAGPSGVGLILDQTEVSSVNRCYIHNYGGTVSAPGAQIWLVNGPDRRAGAQKMWTNEITVFETHLNAAYSNARGVVDDGGMVHKFIYSNFNGGSTQMQVKETVTLSLTGCEMEGASQSVIEISKPVGAVFATTSFTMIDNMMMFADTATGLVIQDNTMDSLVTLNNRYNGLNPDSINGVANVMAFGNRNISGGRQPLNTYYDRKVNVPPFRLIGSTTAGSATFIAQDNRSERNGGVVTVSVDFAINSKGGMSGNVELEFLPFTSSTSYQSLTVSSFGGVSISGFSHITAIVLPATNRLRFYKVGPTGTTPLTTEDITDGFSASLGGPVMVL